MASIVILTRTSDNQSLEINVRPIYAWAWLKTLRTGDKQENMQQVLDSAKEEMERANISEEVISDMISDEIRIINARVDE